MYCNLCSEKNPCPECILEEVRAEASTKQICPACHGQGYIITQPTGRAIDCIVCLGKSYIPKEEHIELYGTQGGGIVKKEDLWFVFVELPEWGNYKIGDVMPSEWSIDGPISEDNTKSLLAGKPQYELDMIRFIDVQNDFLPKESLPVKEIWPPHCISGDSAKQSEDIMTFEECRASIEFHARNINSDASSTLINTMRIASLRSVLNLFEKYNDILKSKEFG